MIIRSLQAHGCFGDQEVHMHFFEGDAVEDSPLFLFFHGVHGVASPEEGNKYAYLARSLANDGYIACLAESSRLRRDKETFEGDRVGWATSAFGGKTFAMEIYDACSTLLKASEEHPDRKIILWGFSLGGLISVILAGKETGTFMRQSGLTHDPLPDVEGLVVSGSGDRTRTEATDIMSLPVLDTLGNNEVIHTSASKVTLSFSDFFYGGCDESFDEESSRRIFRSLRLQGERKTFHILPGVDHAFRTLNGTPSTKPLDRMLEITRATLGRFQMTGG